MKHKTLRFGKGFRVVLGNTRSQAAQMVLAPGKSEGSAKNRHVAADQWLFVVKGTGTANVNGHRHSLRAGSLLLIEHGDRHKILNDGAQDLLTLNFYVPPGYTVAGNSHDAKLVPGRNLPPPLRWERKASPSSARQAVHAELVP